MRRHKRWTEEEIHLLKLFLRTGKPITQAARSNTFPDRDYRSIQRKVQELRQAGELPRWEKQHSTYLGAKS